MFLFFFKYKFALEKQGRSLNSLLKFLPYCLPYSRSSLLLIYIWERAWCSLRYMLKRHRWFKDICVDCFLPQLICCKFEELVRLFFFTFVHFFHTQCTWSFSQNRDTRGHLNLCFPSVRTDCFNLKLAFYHFNYLVITVAVCNNFLKGHKKGTLRLVSLMCFHVMLNLVFMFNVISFLIFWLVQSDFHWLQCCSI